MKTKPKKRKARKPRPTIDARILWECSRAVAGIQLNNLHAWILLQNPTPDAAAIMNEIALRVKAIAP